QCERGHKAFLAKILFSLQQLKINLPSSWPAPLRKHLEDPFRFFQERTKVLEMDLSKRNYVAVNWEAEKRIVVGGMFFSYEPLIDMAVLVHEARHSDEEAAKHVVCWSGEVPRGGIACDNEFSMDAKTAGAYSYSTLFYFAVALYGENISVADREFSMAEGLAQLGSRFNQIPEALGKKEDVLFVLTEQGRLERYNGKVRRWEHLALALPPSEYVVKIEKAPLGVESLLIFTNRGQVWVWSADRELRRFYRGLISDTMVVTHLARTKLPLQDATAFVLLSDHGTLSTVEFSEIGQPELKSYPLERGRPMQEPVPVMKDFFLAIEDEGVFLSEDGRLWQNPRWGDQPVFRAPSSLQSPVGWTSGHGGVLYDALYLVDARGDLHCSKVSYEAQAMDYVKKLNLQLCRDWELPLRKHAQGVQGEVVLDKKGRLVSRPYNSPEAVLLHEGIKDFAVSQKAVRGKPLEAF
ncbi:MAG: hypothetical protein AAGB31_15445, partial [Bdellovibrio sp.]